MGAPVGNKNGVGHGRPPEPHNLTNDQLHELGKELLAWTQSGDFLKAVHLDEFALRIKKFTWKQWKAIIKRDCFREYYETARQMMAFNLLRNKDMHDSMGNRYLCFYDRELHEWEEGIKDKDQARKNSESTNFVQFADNLSQMKQFFDQLHLKQTSENKPSSSDRTE